MVNATESRRTGTPSGDRNVAPKLQGSADPERRFNVLIVSSALHTGGAEQVVCNLATHLDHSRYRVSACYLKENGAIGDQIVRNGIELLSLPGIYGSRPGRFTAFKLLKLIRSRNVDLVHTHDPHGFADACLCRILMPRLRHVHTFHFGNYPHRAARIRQEEKLLWRVPDALVAVGHAQAAAIRSLYGIPESRLHILWNGVAKPTANVSDEVLDAVRSTADPIAASISTLIPQKGVDTLLEATELLGDMGVRFRLLIIGDGPMRTELERQANALRVRNRIRFLGWVSEAAARAMPACDVLVQSSRWEAMSMFVLEAMACGKPVVATRVGDNDRIVSEGLTGLLAPVDDAPALADALRKLLNDAALRERYGRAARERHAAAFTVESMAQHYDKLYAGVLSNGRRRQSR